MVGGVYLPKRPWAHHGQQQLLCHGKTSLSHVLYRSYCQSSQHRLNFWCNPVRALKDAVKSMLSKNHNKAMLCLYCRSKVKITFISFTTGIFTTVVTTATTTELFVDTLQRFHAKQYNIQYNFGALIRKSVFFYSV